MHVSKGVSDKLQSEDLDVVTGCERVADLLTTLRGLRCEKEFDAFWANSITRCHDLNIPEQKKKFVPTSFLGELMTTLTQLYSFSQRISSESPFTIT